MEGRPDVRNPWFLLALGSALFAAMTAVLGKLGVSEVNPNVATLLRTIVIGIFLGTFVMVRGEWEPLSKMSRYGATMLVLSGLATGLSWLCYFHALKLAPASRVAPVDKLSVALVLVFAVLFLGEPITWKLCAGVLLIVAGVILVAR